MAYRAVIQNKTTGFYCNTKGQWSPQETTVAVETRLGAFRLAERLNGEVLLVTRKKVKR